MGRWPLWLLGGLALACALAALSMAAEAAWMAGYPGLADLIGVSRLLVCWLWILPAWRTLRGAPHPVLAHGGRAAVAAVLVLTVLT